MKKAIWTPILLSIAVISSCSIFRTPKNKQFESLLKEQLGIKRILDGKDTLYCRVLLVNGNRINLNQGRNSLPVSGDEFEVFVKLTNGKIHKIEKIDTLVADNKIVREEWIIIKNGGELNFTTTDIQGKLIHFYGQVFPPGQIYGNYIDTSVDSLGNSFTEWGVTGKTVGTRRKK